jgi:hypothetical protein
VKIKIIKTNIVDMEASKINEIANLIIYGGGEGVGSIN